MRPDPSDREVCPACGDQLPYGSDEPLHASCREQLPDCDLCELAILPGDEHDTDDGKFVHDWCCAKCAEEAS